jgi:hypothetical protein
MVNLPVFFALSSGDSAVAFRQRAFRYKALKLFSFVPTCFLKLLRAGPGLGCTSPQARIAVVVKFV